MKLKTSPFSILNKERRELEYIKGVYKRRVQAEIDSYKDLDHENKADTKKKKIKLISNTGNTSKVFTKEEFKLKLILIKILRKKSRQIQSKYKMY